MAFVRNKQENYQLLSRGVFGNTAPSWCSVEEWEASDLYHKYEIWGVRTLTAGGPCRLYCPKDEVRKTAELPEYAKAGVNISMMIDAVCDILLWADVYDSPSGLQVYGIENPPKGGSWRKLMPTTGWEYTGVVAKMLLKRTLNANSLADLEALLEQYPDHVVEFSACDRCIGTVPGRNMILWEVRNTAGSYEDWR